MCSIGDSDVFPFLINCQAIFFLTNRRKISKIVNPLSRKENMPGVFVKKILKNVAMRER